MRQVVACKMLETIENRSRSLTGGGRLLEVFFCVYRGGGRLLEVSNVGL